jgi:hypothetical protein
MALHLTPLSDTTVSQDCIGWYHPELVETGRIVQGYSVSGPLDADAESAVNRDLADRTWRTIFHEGLKQDRRFQRGLFALSHRFTVGGTTVPGPAALLRLLEDTRSEQACSVERVRALSGRRLDAERDYEREYGLALINTAAALVYTIRLCARHELEAVTDSAVHFRLLEQTCAREALSIRNRLVAREGY